MRSAFLSERSWKGGSHMFITALAQTSDGYLWLGGPAVHIDSTASFSSATCLSRAGRSRPRKSATFASGSCLERSAGMSGARLGMGVLAAIAPVRLLPSFSHLLYGVGQSDPLTLFGASAVLLLVASVACYLPARRAMRVRTQKIACEPNDVLS